MRLLRLSLTVALTAALASWPGAASAQPPITEHFHDVGTDVDPDFCGTGHAVDIAFDIVGNVWVSPEGEADLIRFTVEGKVVFTNPETGLSAILSFAGPTTDRIIAGDEEGVHTHEETHAGLPEKLQTANGPVLLRDAGLIVFHITFDENDEVIAFETVVNNGPHPEADSDFALFCEVLTEALGIA